MTVFLGDGFNTTWLNFEHLLAIFSLTDFHCLCTPPRILASQSTDPHRVMKNSYGVGDSGGLVVLVSSGFGDDLVTRVQNDCFVGLIYNGSGN